VCKNKKEIVLQTSVIEINILLKYGEVFSNFIIKQTKKYQ